MCGRFVGFRKLRQRKEYVPIDVADTVVSSYYNVAPSQQIFAIARHDTVFAVKDQYLVSEGHNSIMPKRHTQDWFTLNEQEGRDSDFLLRMLGEDYQNQIQSSNSQR